MSYLLGNLKCIEKILQNHKLIFVDMSCPKHSVLHFVYVFSIGHPEMFMRKSENNLQNHKLIFVDTKTCPTDV